MIKRAGLLVFALPVPTLPHKTRKSGAPSVAWYVGGRRSAHFISKTLMSFLTRHYSQRLARASNRDRS